MTTVRGLPGGGEHAEGCGGKALSRHREEAIGDLGLNGQ